MLFAEKESNLIEAFRFLSISEIALIPENNETESVCLSIHDETLWKDWFDSSAKDAPPPDYYNDSERLMMEVMRVDDHGFKKRGKIINPTYTREHEIERQLRESGFLSQFPEDVRLIINADSGLPTAEDHNYRYYFESFKRTVEHHKQKINNYRRNHPGYKTAFFVYDESTAYVLVNRVPKKIKAGHFGSGIAHLWFCDKRFVEVFKNSEIDYLVWFAPYKMYHNLNRLPQLPTACVYDCHSIDMSLIDYDVEHMISTEV